MELQVNILILYFVTSLIVCIIGDLNSFVDVLPNLYVYKLHLNSFLIKYAVI